MPKPPIQVYIVDDEPSVCTAYARLLRSAKMEPRAFAAVEDFLSSDFSDENACVVSDVQMPRGSGLELPALLERAGHRLPVILVTAHDTPETRERAQRAGAAAYFRKPVDDQALLDAIAWALGGPHAGCDATRPEAVIVSPPPADHPAHNQHHIENRSDRAENRNDKAAVATGFDRVGYGRRVAFPIASPIPGSGRLPQSQNPPL